MVKYGGGNPQLKYTPESIQRLVEGENLDIRNFLHKYESVVEGQRLAFQQKRQDILTGATPCSSETERLALLTTMHDLWAEHLAAIIELREGVQWVEWGGRVPLHEYLKVVHKRFEEMQMRIPEEAAKRQAEANAGRSDPARRGATWTYVTTDQPLGSSLQERIARGLVRKFKRWTA
jgi:preprotein translocase subunit SecA